MNLPRAVERLSSSKIKERALPVWFGLSRLTTNVVEEPSAIELLTTLTEIAAFSLSWIETDKARFATCTEGVSELELAHLTFELSTVKFSSCSNKLSSLMAIVVLPRVDPPGTTISYQTFPTVKSAVDAN